MFATLLVVVLAGLAGPLIAIGPRPLVPTVVGEIVAGAILGRTGFGIIDPATPANSFLYTLGFAMLMLVAGSHVQLRGPALASGARSAAVAFAVVVALALPAGIAIGMIFAPSAPAPLFPVLLAGSSAAVAFPILKERGLLGPQIALLIAWIPIADAATVLLMRLQDPDRTSRRRFHRGRHNVRAGPRPSPRGQPPGAHTARSVALA